MPEINFIIPSIVRQGTDSPLSKSVSDGRCKRWVLKLIVTQIVSSSGEVTVVGHSQLCVTHTSQVKFSVAFHFRTYKRLGPVYPQKMYLRKCMASSVMDVPVDTLQV
jgi:hypothetical protein